jgi:hypothetical protein
LKKNYIEEREKECDHNMWFNWMNTLSSLLNSLQFFLDFNQSRFIIESFIFGNFVISGGQMKVYRK